METLSSPPMVEVNREVNRIPPSHVHDAPRGHNWGHGISMDNENQNAPHQGIYALFFHDKLLV
jgi:hypothetical protein